MISARIKEAFIMNDLNNENFIKVIRFIYDHIDQPITSEDIGRMCGISVWFRCKK